ncbi:hypothetical protein F3Y22_tig00110569pilonHSYRG00354 [Hibiscus syriacus]|uniref:Pentatricopeptide repeat-containing protein n=1 Tax=Hibiscus syriacus TaxID=106335 RepID=A0A6A3A7B0_HIBSY|nr:hypothetical protein F3Y22_tig00110569pilonHSYRG00354 [Hibiscus syriacus]
MDSSAGPDDEGSPTANVALSPEQEAEFYLGIGIAIKAFMVRQAEAKKTGEALSTGQEREFMENFLKGFMQYLEKEAEESKEDNADTTLKEILECFNKLIMNFLDLRKKIGSMHISCEVGKGTDDTASEPLADILPFVFRSDLPRGAFSALSDRPQLPCHQRLINIEVRTKATLRVRLDLKTRELKIFKLDSNSKSLTVADEQLENARNVWNAMKARNIPPNVYTFAITINALCKKNRLHEACELLRKLKCTSIAPKPLIFNPVIDGLCKSRNLDEANLIVEMEEKKCYPHKVTFTILIIGHCMKSRRGRGRRRRWFKKKKETSIVGYGKQIKDFVRIQIGSEGDIASEFTSSSDGELSLDQAEKISEEIEKTFKRRERAAAPSLEAAAASSDSDQAESEDAASIAVAIASQVRENKIGEILSPGPE